MPVLADLQSDHISLESYRTHLLTSQYFMILHILKTCKYFWVNKAIVGSGCRDAPKYVGEGVASHGLWGRPDGPNG